MKTTQKFLLVSLAIAFSGIAISCNQQPEESLHTMSYNLRYDNPGDSTNAWTHRRERVANLIRFYEPDIIGTQEGLLHQLQYLDKQFKNMGRIGVGRNDGNAEGEFTAIYFDSNKLELISDSTMWLSETPAEPSKSWDAALPRILTFGRFKSRASGQEFYVFNTHFDHIGDTARAESAKLILETIDEVAGESPVVVTGDFNAPPDSEPYQILTEQLSDAYENTEIPHVGPLFTFKGFAVNGNQGQERRIDYIFTNSQVEVLKHAIIPDFRNGSFTSDHLPVIVDLTFKK